MNFEKFREWLLIQAYTASTVKNRISNIRKIERYYGGLDEAYLKDSCESILKALVYTITDEAEGKSPKHIIPINGNIYNGSATYRLALKLFLDFKIFESDQVIYRNVHQITSEKTVFDKLTKTLTNALGGYKFNIKTKTRDLEIEVFRHFESNLNPFSWALHHKPSSKYKDCFDIYGFSVEDNCHIVIELDASRADQVAKKFLSRMALFLESNVLYISLCYPGTKRMSKTECSKYFEYCANLCDFISENTAFKKKYLGYYL